ncbi:uncharacterized protein ARB_00317 [Trichophyton benhamiae CBS 112371]|uniref:Uncharacterized protein n=1 Tax=Arthroderma benhamiae (strain ATCC MYA-4681 / CBS 112371) TaxID=663331 RepID=D4AVV3_ARTBC|nr:uncharacterized protein ARB_00317 [Trichophyton benhamiae CBS 112371]EFE32859.1 hypothetical protein ARB_00317 [Trichophyton benhamiae CBS 112371]
MQHLCLVKREGNSRFWKLKLVLIRRALSLLLWIIELTCQRSSYNYLADPETGHGLFLVLQSADVTPLALVLDSGYVLDALPAAAAAAAVEYPVDRSFDYFAEPVMAQGCLVQRKGLKPSMYYM